LRTYNMSTPVATVSLFFLFTLAMCAVAACVSVFVASARTAQSVGYGLIIVGFVFQALLSGLYGGAWQMLPATSYDVI